MPFEVHRFVTGPVALEDWERTISNRVGIPRRARP